MNRLSKQIKLRRNEKKLTVRELAAIAGVSAGYISRIEGLGEIPTAEIICRLGQALEIAPEELLELAKADFLEKTKADISQKHEEGLRLFRRGK